MAREKTCEMGSTSVTTLRHLSPCSKADDQARPTTSVATRNARRTRSRHSSAILSRHSLTRSLFDEIYGDSIPGSSAELNYQFDHCLLKTREDLTSHVTECIFNEDPDFYMPEEGNSKDFHLTEFSPCVNTGNTITTGTEDLDMVIRDSNPDIGVYEYVP